MYTSEALCVWVLVSMNTLKVLTLNLLLTDYFFLQIITTLHNKKRNYWSIKALCCYSSKTLLISAGEILIKTLRWTSLASRSRFCLKDITPDHKCQLLEAINHRWVSNNPKPLPNTCSRDIYVSRKQLQENNHRKVSAIIVNLNPCKLTRTYLAIFSEQSWCHLGQQRMLPCVVS